MLTLEKGLGPFLIYTLPLFSIESTFRLQTLLSVSKSEVLKTYRLYVIDKKTTTKIALAWCFM